MYRCTERGESIRPVGHVSVTSDCGKETNRFGKVLDTSVAIADPAVESRTDQTPNVKGFLLHQLISFHMARFIPKQYSPRIFKNSKERYQLNKSDDP